MDPAFPATGPYRKSASQKVKTMTKRLVRIMAHIYYRHMPDLMRASLSNSPAANTRRGLMRSSKFSPGLKSKARDQEVEVPPLPISKPIHAQTLTVPPLPSPSSSSSTTHHGTMLHYTTHPTTLPDTPPYDHAIWSQYCVDFFISTFPIDLPTRRYIFTRLKCTPPLLTSPHC